MPIPRDQKIIVTSPDGSKRRRLPATQITDAECRIERFGGFGEFTLNTAVPSGPDALATIQQGDRVEFYYQGTLRYRGWIEERTRTLTDPDRLAFVGYGLSFLVRRQLCYGRYAYVAGGTDIADAFAEVVRDFMASRNQTIPSAVGRAGLPLFDALQCQKIGTRATFVDAYRKLSGDVLDDLVRQSGNLAIWGGDVDAFGQNRLYIRPLAPVSPPATHTLLIPSRQTEAGQSEQQAGDVKNRALIVGGNPRFPQMIHNGGFDLPLVSQEGDSGVISDGDFENLSWSLSNGAAFKDSGHQEGQAFSGNWMVEMDHAGEACDRGGSYNFVAGHNYTFSVRARKEVGQQVCRGSGTLQIKDAGGHVLTTVSLALAPAGTAWDYFSSTFQMPVGAAQWHARFQCDQIQPFGGDQGGLLVDAADLNDADVVYQDGWQAAAFGAARVIAANWAYKDTAYDGLYCVHLAVSASDADGQDVNLQPLGRARVPVGFKQTVRFGMRFRSPVSPAAGLGLPKMLLYLFFYRGDNSYISTSVAAVPAQAASAAWQYAEALAGGPADAATVLPVVALRSSGEVLIDCLSLQDAAAQAEENAANDFVAEGALSAYVRAADPALGLDAAHAGSEAVFGSRTDIVQQGALTTAPGLTALGKAQMQAEALPLTRPGITRIADPRVYWPGDSVSLQGRTGPSLSGGQVLTVAAVRLLWGDLFKTILEIDKEAPAPDLIVKQLILDQLRKNGPGAGSAGAGGGYTNPTNYGAGNSGSAAYRATLAASPADPTLHDAFTGVPHAGQASQDGWNATTAEVVQARTRTVKASSALTLEGRLDAMEADIASGGGGAAGAGDHKVALSAVDGSPDYLDAKTGAALPLSVADAVVGNNLVRQWSMTRAGAASDGWLSAADWGRFNAVTAPPGVPTVPSWLYECLDAPPALSDLAPFRPSQMTPLITVNGDLIDTNAQGAARTTVWGQKAFYTTKLVVLQATQIQVDCTADNSARCTLNGVQVGPDFGDAFGGPGSLGAPLRLTLPLRAGANLLRFRFSQDDDGGGTNSGFTCAGVGRPLALLVDQQIAPLPRPDMASTVPLAGYAASLVPGATYLLTADLSGSGSFADAGYSSWFAPLSGIVVIQDNKALWSPALAAWTVWVRPPSPNGYAPPPNGYAPPPPVQETLLPTLKGLWDGPPGAIPAAYSLQQIA